MKVFNFTNIEENQLNDLDVRLHDNWAAKVLSFVDECEAGVGSDTAIVVALRQLIAEAPVPLQNRLGDPHQAIVFEMLIECEASESAAIRMVGGDTGLMVARSPNGHAVATVNFPDAGIERTAVGDTVTGAICGALAKASVAYV